jgi:hypothetical protein
LSRNDNRRGVLMTVGRRGAFAKVRGVVAIPYGQKIETVEKTVSCPFPA